MSYHFIKNLALEKIASSLNNDSRYKNLAPNDVWKSGTITSILTNPIYAGYTAYKDGKPKMGCHIVR